MAKGEIAHHEQFLLLPQCFQKTSVPEASESVCMREMVKITTLRPKYGSTGKTVVQW